MSREQLEANNHKSEADDDNDGDDDDSPIEREAGVYPHRHYHHDEDVEGEQIDASSLYQYYPPPPQPPPQSDEYMILPLLGHHHNHIPYNHSGQYMFLGHQPLLPALGTGSSSSESHPAGDPSTATTTTTATITTSTTTHDLNGTFESSSSTNNNSPPDQQPIHGTQFSTTSPSYVPPHYHASPYHRHPIPTLLLPSEGGPLDDPYYNGYYNGYNPSTVLSHHQLYPHHQHHTHWPPPPPPPPPPGSPLETITNIEPQDVLSGRGGATNSHSGNRAFRSLVKSYQERYLLAKKRDKPAVAAIIVDLVREKGGRFLRKWDTRQPDGQILWIDIGNDRAIEKTCQALREGAPEIRRKRSKKHYRHQQQHSTTESSYSYSDEDNNNSNNINEPESRHSTAVGTNRISTNDSLMGSSSILRTTSSSSTVPVSRSLRRHDQDHWSDENEYTRISVLATSTTSNTRAMSAPSPSTNHWTAHHDSVMGNGNDLATREVLLNSRSRDYHEHHLQTNRDISHDNDTAINYNVPLHDTGNLLTMNDRNRSISPIFIRPLSGLQPLNRRGDMVVGTSSSSMTYWRPPMIQPIPLDRLSTVERDMYLRDFLPPYPPIRKNGPTI